VSLPRNTVTAEQIAPRAVQSSEAHNLTLAGAAGSAPAFAHIRDGDLVVEADSKGVSDAQVTIANGSTCFYNLGFDPRSVVADIENAGLDYRLLRVRSAPDNADTDCPGAEDASVTLPNGDLTRHTGAGSAVNVHVTFN
jgi:hypothetical protein